MRGIDRVQVWRSLKISEETKKKENDKTTAGAVFTCRVRHVLEI